MIRSIMVEVLSVILVGDFMMFCRFDLESSWQKETDRGVAAPGVKSMLKSPIKIAFEREARFSTAGEKC